MKNVKLLFFIINIILIFKFSLSSLCKDSIFDPIFINTPSNFRVQPSKEICYKYKLTNSKNKISLTFSLAKSYTSEVVIYKSLYEIRMKNGEYIDYRDKYFIVDYTFKEIDVKDFYDYVYIIIRETKNYFFNDKIVLYDSEVPITLEGNSPIEMTHFMSNNEYIFTFSSNKNLQFVYGSKVQSQKFVTVEYDGKYALKGKFDNKDFIINLENEDLSEKVLNIKVTNYNEDSKVPDFSIIVYEKEPNDIIKIEEEKSIEIFYIQNDMPQYFYFYSDISEYTKSGSVNFKVDYMIKNIKYMNIISDIIYSDKALNSEQLKENLPEKNNLEYSYDINSDEFIRFYFHDNEQNDEYKYIIIKLEIKDYLIYFSPKSFTVSLSKELEEINLKQIPYYTTKTISKSTKPYIPNYFKLLFDQKSTYILTAPYQDYILLLKGDLLSNSKINQDYLDDQKDIIIIRDISELTVQIFGNELNAVFYVEKIDPKEIYIIEENRDIKEITVNMTQEECNSNEKKHILGTYNKEMYEYGVNKDVKYWVTNDGEMNLYYKNEISIDEQSLFPSLLKNKKSNLTSIVLNNHIDLFTITCTKPGSLLLKPIMKTFSEKTHIMGQNSRSIFTLSSNVEILQLTSPMKSPAKYLYLSILSLQGNNIRITPDTKGIFDETEIKGNKLFTQKIDIEKHKSDELAFIISANISSIVDIEVIEVIHYNFSEYENIKSNKKQELTKNNFVKFIDKNVKKLIIDVNGLNNVSVTYGIVKLATNDINYIPLAFKYRTDVMRKNFEANEVIEIDNKYYDEDDIYKNYQAFIFSIHSSKMNFKYDIQIEEIVDKKGISGWALTLIIIVSILLFFIALLMILMIKKRKAINADSIKYNQPLYPNTKYILNDMSENNE